MYTVADYYIVCDIWISDIRPHIWNSWPKFKLSAKDLDIQPKIIAWIWRLVFTSLAEILGIRYPANSSIKSGP